MMNQAMNNLENVAKFWSAVGERNPQEWPMDHEDVIENDLFVVKRFKKGSSGSSRLVNPPMAGHHSNIAFRVVKFYMDITEDSVYSIEYKSANRKTKDHGVDTLVDHVGYAMDAIRAEEAGPIHCAGLCQGGWTLAMWTALNPERVASLTIAGTPIDFAVDGGKIQDGLKYMSDDFVHWTIVMNGGIWPAQAQLAGFKMLNPVDRYVGTYVDLMEAILMDSENGDDKATAKWVRNNSWYEHAQNLPGRMIREVVRDLFRGNKLVKKQLFVHGELVDLSNITCPVVAITGDEDDITLERQCSSILDHVSSEFTAHYHIPECGHIAIFLTNDSIERWAEGLEFVERSI